MLSEPVPLNGAFGVSIDGATPADLEDPAFRRRAVESWRRHGGLLAVRGDALADLSPAALMAWAGAFGAVDEARVSAREHCTVDGTPILRIGNVRDEHTGAPRSMMTTVPSLRSEADVRYDPETRRPVWHTDGTFKRDPPIGSVFHCKRAPPSGAETLFADTRAAYADLDAETRERLQFLEAVCSLAHHDRKINLYSPGYPTLSPEQRAAHPARRVPVVLVHPETCEPAIYGLNSSTCAVVPKGEPIAEADMDRYDLEGVEDDSVLTLRNLLPHITGPHYTVRWRWKPGDVVVWDNRCTMHAGTGFDAERYTREMWRLTLLDRRTNAPRRRGASP